MLHYLPRSKEYWLCIYYLAIHTAQLSIGYYYWRLHKYTPIEMMRRLIQNPKSTSAGCFQLPNQMSSKLLQGLR